MKVVVNQSNYLPWKGYFDLIHDADLFIFHDDLQYTKNDWRNRNRIKTPRGLEWLTIPVGTSEHRLIAEVRLPEDASWAGRHWRLMEEHYRHAPRFGEYREFFREVLLNHSYNNLADFNQQLIQRIARDLLGIRTQFIDSRQFALTSRKQERVLDLLRAVGATHYVSGPAARDYLDSGRFQAEGIRLEWKDYSGYPEYPQFHPPFAHAVSIIDLLFHCGSSSPAFIWGWRPAHASAVMPA